MQNHRIHSPFKGRLLTVFQLPHNYFPHCVNGFAVMQCSSYPITKTAHTLQVRPFARCRQVNYPAHGPPRRAPSKKEKPAQGTEKIAEQGAKIADKNGELQVVCVNKKLTQGIVQVKPSLQWLHKHDMAKKTRPEKRYQRLRPQRTPSPPRH